MTDLDALKALYQASNPRVALQPEDPRYVPLYEGSDTDPVEGLAHGIEWAEGESVQTFSGFPGSGKSTQLNRLARLLRDGGAVVAVVDVEQYLNLYEPLDIVDFLLAICGAFSDALDGDDLLGRDVALESWWDRTRHWWTTTELTPASVGAKTGGPGTGADIRLNLKEDPSFRARIKERAHRALGTFVQGAHEFVAEGVAALRRRHGAATPVILLVDSVEKVRGTSINDSQVTASVELLFTSHADSLRLPGCHLVYTVPPWLKVRAAGYEAHFDGSAMLPSVRVRTEAGDRDETGLDLLARVATARGAWERMLGDRAALDRISLASGGYMRDFLRMLRSCAQRGRRGAPLPEAQVDGVIAELRDDYLPITDQDALWLDRVRTSHEASIADQEALPGLARLFTSHLILCYRNGHEWYGVHPVVEDDVRRIAAKIRGDG